MIDKQIVVWTPKTMQNFDFLGNIRRYSLDYLSPSRCWQDGISMGNGDLNALAWEEDGLYPRWELNHSRIWDERVPHFKRHSMEHIRRIAAGEFPFASEMSKEAMLDDVPYAQMNTPKYGGFLRLCFGLQPQHAPAHRITKRLDLAEATLETSLDRHLSHPRIASYVCASENLLVVSARHVSLVTAFRNTVEIGRDAETCQPAAVASAEDDMMFLSQSLPTMHYVIAAKVVPRGGGEYRALFDKMTDPRNYSWGEPSKTVQCTASRDMASARLAGDFDVILTIVTSKEGEEPLNLAKKRLDDAAKRLEALRAEHVSKWADFWKANAVELNQPFLNRLWYLSNYHLRCGMGGPVPFGLCGPWIGRSQTSTHALPWNGCFTNDYNAQLPNMAADTVNHPNLSMPMFRLLKEQLPNAQRNAAELETPGALYPITSGLSGVECGSGPYRFCQVAGPYWCFVMLRHYRMTHDDGFLENTFLPVLEQVSLFFCNWLEWNEKEQKYHLRMSQNPELMYFTLEDPTDTLAYLKATLQAAVQHLPDGELAKKCRHVLAHYPDYALHPNGILALRGFPTDHMHHFRTVTPLYPTGEADPLHPSGLLEHARMELDNPMWDYFMKSYACREGFQEGWTGRVYHRAIPACRLGNYQLAHKLLCNLIAGNVKPNGLVSHNIAILADSRQSEANIANVPETQTHHDHGPEPIRLLEVASGRCWEECTEDLECKEKMFPVLEGPAVYLLLVSEMLMQCYNGVLRLFPCWDKRKDASFISLRAEGAMLVSSELKDGIVRYVQIKAEKPVEFTLLSPWDTPVYIGGKGPKPLERLSPFHLESRQELLISVDAKPEFAEQFDKAPLAGVDEIFFDDGTGAILGKPEMSKYYAFLEKIRGF